MFRIDIGELNALQNIILKDVEKELKQSLKKQANSTISSIIEQLLMSPHTRQQHRDNPYRKALSADAGSMYDMLYGMTTDLVLSEEMEEYAQQYITEHWKDHMAKALDMAMEHRAKKIAFSLASKMQG